MVAIKIEKLVIAVAGFSPNPKKYMSNGMIIEPPPIPAITPSPYKIINITIPNHSIDNYGNTVLCTH
jgi:hypothetical protein